MGAMLVPRRRQRRLAYAAMVLGAFALGACTSEPEPVRPVITATKAYTAIVRWEIDQIEPVVDAKGDVQTPVIYVAASSGGTVDVTVQAAVVSTIDEATAVIRFTDDVRDARDTKLEGEPVKNNGVLIVVDDFAVGQRTADARITRYRSTDDAMTWLLVVTATADGADVTSATPAEDTPT